MEAYTCVLVNSLPGIVLDLSHSHFLSRNLSQQYDLKGYSLECQGNGMIDT